MAKSIYISHQDLYSPAINCKRADENLSLTGLSIYREVPDKTNREANTVLLNFLMKRAGFPVSARIGFSAGMFTNSFVVSIIKQ